VYRSSALLLLAIGQRYESFTGFGHDRSALVLQPGQQPIQLLELVANLADLAQQAASTLGASPLARRL